MRRLDLYWMKNKDWWKFENGCTIIKDTAPQDAQESYNRYLLQNGLDVVSMEEWCIPFSVLRKHLKTFTSQLRRTLPLSSTLTPAWMKSVRSMIILLINTKFVVIREVPQ